MAVTVTLNGVAYSIPSPGDTDEWGAALNAYLVALGTTGGGAGGSNTHVQFNDSGALGGNAGFVYNKTTRRATVNGIGSDGYNAAFTAANATTFTGGYGSDGSTTTSGGAAIALAVGAGGDVYHGGAGTLSSALGVSGYVANTGAGIIDSGVALYGAAIQNTGGGSVVRAMSASLARQTVGTTANFYLYAGLLESAVNIAVLTSTARLGLGLDDPLTKLHIADGLITHAGTTGITAAAGGTQAAAVAITNEVAFVTVCATIADSVKLPTAGLGVHVIVHNLGAQSLSIFPASGGTIDALGVNLAYALAAGGVREFWGQSTTQWRSKA